MIPTKLMFLKLLFVSFLLFAYSVSGIAAPDLDKQEVVRNYDKIKRVVDQGKTVRVMAWVKGRDTKLHKLADNKSKLKKAKAALKGARYKVSKELNRLGMMVMEVDNTELEALLATGEFDRVELDELSRPHLSSSLAITNTHAVHNMGYGGYGQAVAILDTGVDLDHSFYSDRLVEGACFSTNNSVASSFCPGGLEQVYGLYAAADCPDYIDGCGHGTHVAGIAAGNGSTLMRGVANQSNIVAVQVFSEFSANYETCNGAPCARSYTSDQLQALEWILNGAQTQNIAAVNMSIGGGSYEYACDDDPRASVITALKEAGIVTVISAGNDSSTSSVSAPGCITDAITVGSTWKTADVISGFSNSSTLVDIFAPGSDIRSSGQDGGFRYLSGTSMAAPHITGAIAVMRGINTAATFNDIETSLLDFGEPIMDSRNGLVFPRLDLAASSNAIEDMPIAKIDSKRYIGRVNQMIEFSANASTDPGGAALTYYWDFGDGTGEYVTSLPYMSYVYDQIGTYKLTLNVNNGQKQDSSPDVVNVTVTDPALFVPIFMLLL